MYFFSSSPWEGFFRTNADTLLLMGTLDASHTNVVKDIVSIHRQLSTTAFISKLKIDATCPPNFAYSIVAQHGRQLTKIKSSNFSIKLLREILKACSEYRVRNPTRGLLQNVVELDLDYPALLHGKGAFETEWISFFAELSGLRILGCNPTFAIRLAATDSINMPNLHTISITRAYLMTGYSTDPVIVSFSPSAVPVLRSLRIYRAGWSMEKLVQQLFAKVSHQIQHLYLGNLTHGIYTWLRLGFHNVMCVTLDSDNDFKPTQFLSDSLCHSFDLIVPWPLLFENYKKHGWRNGNYDALIAEINQFYPEANLFVQVDHAFYESRELRTLHPAVAPTKTRRYQLKVPDKDAGVSLQLEAPFDLMKRLLDKRPSRLREIQFV